MAKSDCSKEVHHGKKTGKKTGKLDLFPIINGIIMVLFIVITLYPVLNTLAISLNDGTDALRGGIYLLPRKFTWKNYITVLQKDNLITGAYITVARTIIGTLLALVANAILAFIVSRKRFLFKKELSLFWVITMYVNGGMIPTFLLYKQLGLTNSFGVYVIPGMVSAFNMLVIRTYMNGISDSLEESAQLDGAGYTTIFLKIYSPLCKPVYATVALFVAVGQWNSWFDAMLYNRMNSNLTTLQYELMKLLSSVTNQGTSVEAMKNAAGSVTPTSVRAAATIITMLPIICIYPFLQKYFVAGLTLGGVKNKDTAFYPGSCCFGMTLKYYMRREHMKIAGKNPITELDYPDPDVIRVDDTYYMVSTTMHFMPGCEILRSYDLIHWEHLSYVYERLDSTEEQRLVGEKNCYGKGMWAASLRYHKGMYYICFVANDTGKTYLYTADDIEGPWEKRIIEGFYHDCSLLFEDDHVYIVSGNRNVRLQELKKDLGGPKEGGLDRFWSVIVGIRGLVLKEVIFIKSMECIIYS